MYLRHPETQKNGDVPKNPEKGRPSEKNASAAYVQDAVYGSLTDLSLMLSALYPKQKVRNPYRRLASKVELPWHIERKGALELYDRLVHGLTVLNRMYRHKEKGHILSAREDALTALMLMRGIAFPHTVLGKRTLRFYKEIEDTQGHRKYFTAWRLRRDLGLSKTTVARHLMLLRRSGLVHRVGGNVKSGYLYELLPHPSAQ